MKSIRVNMDVHKDECETNVTIGKINSKEHAFILDSGVTISIVPEELVKEEQFIDGSVCIVGANGGRKSRKVAVVDIEFATCTWRRRVAVAPSDTLRSGALLAINLNNPEHMQLVSEYSKSKRKSALAVLTRKESAEEEQMLQKEAEFLQQVAPQESVADTSVQKEGEKSTECDDSNSEVIGKEGKKFLVAGKEDEASLGVELNSSEVGAEVVCDEVEGKVDDKVEGMDKGNDKVDCVSEGVGNLLELPLLSVDAQRPQFWADTSDDASLQPWRTPADQGSKGFFWKGRCLYRRTTDPCFQTLDLLVLPLAYREKVIRIAHDGTGLIGHRKVLGMLRKRFDWPLMTKDVTSYCSSCATCQKCNKSGGRKAPMVPRPVCTEPFESLALTW